MYSFRKQNWWIETDINTTEQINCKRKQAANLHPLGESKTERKSGKERRDEESEETEVKAPYFVQFENVIDHRLLLNAASHPVCFSELQPKAP